jgi:hypothetical protein
VLSKAVCDSPESRSRLQGPSAVRAEHLRVFPSMETADGVHFTDCGTERAGL